MVKFQEFIHVYDDGLEPQICQYLIEEFENNKNLHQKIDNDKRPSFTQFNITQHRELNKKLYSAHSHLISKTFDLRDRYYSSIGEDFFPEEHSFEQFRIKKYDNNNYDQFDTHVDVQDYATARRYLAFLWYLNDVESGGNTVLYDFFVKPKEGRVLIFPPLWTFPHKGEPPISGPKYILSGYLHYN